ncbi:MAG: hypothetical protein Q9159_004192 [Coniocarpon cinnabarinum]
MEDDQEEDTSSVVSYTTWLAQKRKAEREKSQESPTPTTIKDPVSLINEHCSRNGQASPAFSYERSDAGRFRATLVLSEGTFSGEEFSASLKEARRLVCQRAISDLNLSLGRPVKASRTSVVQDCDEDLQPNAVQYLQLQPPRYTDLGDASNSQFFTVRVTLSESLNQAFDSPRAFTSKSVAKAAAAREAVTWLKANKYLPEEFDGSRVKKARKANASTHVVRDEGSNSASSSSDEKIEMKSTKAKTADNGTVDTSSPPTHAHTLALSLNLPPPHYESHSNPTAPSFWTVTAHFPSLYITPSSAHKGGHRPLGSEIARVEGVFGRERARRECAKRVVEWLEREKERRNDVLRGGTELWE